MLHGIYALILYLKKINQSFTIWHPMVWPPKKTNHGYVDLEFCERMSTRWVDGEYNLFITG